MPVVVEVAHRTADAVGFLAAGDAGNARAVGHVRERPITVIPVEPVAEAVRLRAYHAAGQAGALGQEQIEPAIAIHVDQATAGPDHLRIIVRTMVSVIVDKPQPGFPRAVDE